MILNAPPRAGSHDSLLFVDNVRFWSMVGIIAVHTLYRWDVPDATATSELRVVLLQMAKFGTIGFYVISGFLLGGRLEYGSPGQYLLRRVKNVGVPWAVWASVAVGLAVIPAILHGEFPWHFWPAVVSVGRNAWRVIFYSPFWFVPNFLFSLSLLLMFRRYLDEFWLGAVLLACALFYSVNIYRHWIPSAHTTAICGFTFYQWLGVWAARNSKLVFAFIESIQMRLLFGVILLTGGLALAETHLLFHFNKDGYNTLRLSNQLFSVAVVVALVRLPRPTWPHFLNVHDSTFGLYLLHGICLGPVGFAMIFVHKHVMPGSFAAVLAHPALALIVWLALFIQVYVFCTAIISVCLKNQKLSWLFGRRPASVPSMALKRFSFAPEESADQKELRGACNAPALAPLQAASVAQKFRR